MGKSISEVWQGVYRISGNIKLCKRILVLCMNDIFKINQCPFPFSVSHIQIAYKIFLYCIVNLYFFNLKMSGIDVVTLAIESGNPRILKEIIHKPLKLEMVPHAIACLNKYDIYVKISKLHTKSFFIVL